MSTAQPIVTPDQVGVLLQSARRHRGLTQQSLAARMGISQARLSELERAAGDLSLNQLLAMCQHLGLQLVIRDRAAPALKPARAPGHADW